MCRSYIDATVTVISRISLVLANCLAIGATWFTMHRDHVFSYVEGSGRRTLAGVLLWDGEWIFGCLVTCNVLTRRNEGLIYFV